MARKRKNIPSIYVDEHIDRSVANVFRFGFRTVEIARNPKLKGREERDYLKELYKDNGIFLTSDIRFSRDVLEKGIKHAGIVYLPNMMDLDEKLIFAVIVRDYIKLRCYKSPFAIRNYVIYPGADGFRVATKEGEELEFSWDRFFRYIPDGFFNED